MDLFDKLLRPLEIAKVCGCLGRSENKRIDKASHQGYAVGTSKPPDAGKRANQSAAFVRQLRHMLELARVITLGALARDESRGSHYKPAFEARDDEKWLVTTLKFSTNSFV